MINLTFAGMDQMSHALPYIMIFLMVVTAIAQVKYVFFLFVTLFIYYEPELFIFLLQRFLNIAMKHYDATVVVPTNFVFFTISAILSG